MVISKLFEILFFIIRIPMHLAAEKGPEIQLETYKSKDFYDKEEIELGKLTMNSNEYAKIEEKIRNIENDLGNFKDFSSEERAQFTGYVSEEDAVDKKIYIKMVDNTAVLEDEDIKEVERIIDGNVLGGDYADIIEYPHAVFITGSCAEGTLYPDWWCGSTIINQRVLLSAAHCVPECKVKKEVYSYAGSSDYTKSTVVRKVLRAKRHKDFDNKTMTADIALLFMNEGLHLGPTMQRVIISSSFPQKADALECVVAGWGVIDKSLTRTEKLKVVQQYIWPKSDCLQYLTLPIGTLCASSGTKNNHPHRGDSGSALINNYFQQMGIVSFRDKKKPELFIYTNVTYYYSWIDEWSKKLYCYHNKI